MSLSLNELRGPMQRILSPFVSALARVGLTPNGATILGFLLNAAAGALLALGYITTGGIVLIVASLFDLVDGLLARTTGQTTQFGAFLDSTVDRYSESALFFGLIIYHVSHQEFFSALLMVLALIGSQQVSYTRARAEGLGVKGEVGLMPRPERMFLLATGLLSGSIIWEPLWFVANVLLAVLTNLTVLQRVLYVRRQLKS
ncbi:MAG: CDP-alcohol phosphatidyltransferase family protein [Chloroflexi bacterium]|nr:CDP-alcohol phosphatidyltransferase family protein [Chloroflexota bacterium]